MQPTPCPICEGHPYGFTDEGLPGVCGRCDGTGVQPCRDCDEVATEGELCAACAAAEATP